MKPQAKIAIRWNKDFAYAIGLITTDGCLSSDGRHIDFTSQDIQLVETFRKCLGINNKIGFKASGTSPRKCPHVQFGDSLFHRWLIDIGITPRKSKTIGELKIPDKYFYDFIRGHFDGDGCCYSYWDKRWVNSFMFYMTLVSASEGHINWLRKKIRQMAGINGHITRAGKNQIFQLKYAKRESKILAKKIYYKNGLPCLKRKYIKIMSAIKTDLSS